MRKITISNELVRKLEEIARRESRALDELIVGVLQEFVAAKQRAISPTEISNPVSATDQAKNEVGETP